MMAVDLTSRLYDPLLNPFLKEIRAAVRDLVEEYGFETILDVCCGTGIQLKALEEKGYRPMGVDISDGMLAVAMRGQSPTRCMKQDAARLGFRDRSFDLVMVSLAIHDKDLKTAGMIIDEMFRVVKSGGHLLFVDYDFSPMTKIHARKVITFIEWLAGGDHYRNFREYNSLGGIEAFLRDRTVYLEKKLLFAGNGIALKLFRAG